jgi:hypothetical protein
MKRLSIIALGSVRLAVLAGIYLLKASHAPVGQRPLTEMNEAALSGLQAEFNRTAASARVILLLSPT